MSSISEHSSNEPTSRRQDPYSLIRSSGGIAPRIFRRHEATLDNQWKTFKDRVSNEEMNGPINMARIVFTVENDSTCVTAKEKFEKVREIFAQIGVRLGSGDAPLEFKNYQNLQNRIPKDFTPKKGFEHYLYPTLLVASGNDAPEH